MKNSFSLEPASDRLALCIYIGRRAHGIKCGPLGLDQTCSGCWSTLQWYLTSDAGIHQSGKEVAVDDEPAPFCVVVIGGSCGDNFLQGLTLLF
jgi:hypothetical protein